MKFQNHCEGLLEAASEVSKSSIDCCKSFHDVLYGGKGRSLGPKFSSVVVSSY